MTVTCIAPNDIKRSCKHYLMDDSCDDTRACMHKYKDGRYFSHGKKV